MDLKTDHVKDAVFWHLNRRDINEINRFIKVSPWKIGKTKHFGTEKNLRWQSFLQADNVIVNDRTKKAYPFDYILNYIVKKFLQQNGDPELDSDFPFNPNLESLSDPKSLLIAANQTLNYSLTLLYELILEDVREKHFPSKPSRSTCLWTIPDDEKQIEMWTKGLMRGLNSVKRSPELIKLSLTGKIHCGNSYYHKSNSLGLTKLYERAFKYWRSEPSPDPKCEYLFEGEAKVLDIIPLDRFLQSRAK